MSLPVVFEGVKCYFPTAVRAVDKLAGLVLSLVSSVMISSHFLGGVHAVQMWNVGSWLEKALKGFSLT